MSLLDDLRGLAATLPGEAKPVLAELPDIVAALIHLVEQNAGPGAAASPTAAATTPDGDPAAGDEPETVGSMVFDAAADQAAADPAPPPSLSAVDDEPADETELEAEIRAKQDELQSLQVKRAHSQRTVLDSTSTAPADS